MDLAEQRKKYRAQHHARPDPGALIVLNFADRDAAREVYQTMEAMLHGEIEKRTGKRPECCGLNSASVVDEIVHAINLSRVKQAEANLVCLREGQGILG